MRRIALVLIAVLWAVAVSAQTYDLPNNNADCPGNCRKVPWSAGSDQWNSGALPVYPGVTCTGLTEGDGTTDNTSAINACITAASVDTAVLIPAGIYYVNGTIALKTRVVLRGAGIGTPWLPTANAVTTTLKFGAGGLVRVGGTGLTRGTERVISSGYTKGSTTLVMADGHGFSANDWIAVFEDGDDTIPATTVGHYGGCTWCGENNGSNLIQQFVQVLTVDGNTITISRPLYYTYTAAKNPGAKVVTWAVQKAGLESLRVNGTADMGGRGLIQVIGCLDCWVKGVETYNASPHSGGDHVTIQWSHAAEIRDSYLHHGQGDYSSGQNYGLGFYFWNSDHKVENNILRDHRHSLSFEGGGSGCAILYNYIDENHDNGGTGPYSVLGSARINHGAHPMFNLYEGNSISHLEADNFWGSSSHMVLFRNWLRGEQSYPPNIGNTFGHSAIDVWPQNHYYSYVGNVLGESSWSIGVLRTTGLASCQSQGYGPAAYFYGCGTSNQTWDATPGTTSINHGNYDYISDSVAYWEGGANHTLASSLYYATKPSFLGTYAWPTMGPDLGTMTGALPANSRYLGTAPAAPSAVSIPVSASPALQWTHSGAAVTHFDALIDGTTVVNLGLPTPSGTTWTASVPTLAAGSHSLSVRACNLTICTAASAALTIVKLEE